MPSPPNLGRFSKGLTSSGAFRRNRREDARDAPPAREPQDMMNSRSSNIPASQRSASPLLPTPSPKVGPRATSPAAIPEIVEVVESMSLAPSGAPASPHRGVVPAAAPAWTATLAPPMRDTLSVALLLLQQGNVDAAYGTLAALNPFMRVGDADLRDYVTSQGAIEPALAAIKELGRESPSLLTRARAVALAHMLFPEGAKATADEQIGELLQWRPNVRLLELYSLIEETVPSASETEHPEFARLLRFMTILEGPAAAGFSCDGAVFKPDTNGEFPTLRLFLESVIREIDKPEESAPEFRVEHETVGTGVAVMHPPLHKMPALLQDFAVTLRAGMRNSVESRGSESPVGLVIGVLSGNLCIEAKRQALEDLLMENLETLVGNDEDHIVTLPFVMGP
jgi:hypothetical protein